jgi:hypothetical protein
VYREITDAGEISIPVRPMKKGYQTWAQLHDNVKRKWGTAEHYGAPGKIGETSWAYTVPADVPWGALYADPVWAGDGTPPPGGPYLP